MIPYNKKTTQDFLSIEEMESLSKLGVEFVDAKYTIIKRKGSDELKYIVYGGHGEWRNLVDSPDEFEEVIQTYTLSELLYKLPEWLISDGYAGLRFFKDAPFYAFYYENDEDSEKQDDSTFPVEYPIISASLLLKWCIRHKHGYVQDVSDK